MGGRAQWGGVHSFRGIMHPVFLPLTPFSHPTFIPSSFFYSPFLPPLFPLSFSIFFPPAGWAFQLCHDVLPHQSHSKQTTFSPSKVAQTTSQDSTVLSPSNLSWTWFFLFFFLFKSGNRKLSFLNTECLNSFK